MRNKTLIGSLLLVIVLTCTILIFQPTVRAGSRSKGAAEPPCRARANDGKMIWENLPHQFFSSL